MKKIYILITLTITLANCNCETMKNQNDLTHLFEIAQRQGFHFNKNNLKNKDSLTYFIDQLKHYYICNNSDAFINISQFSDFDDSVYFLINYGISLDNQGSVSIEYSIEDSILTEMNKNFVKSTISKSSSNPEEFVCKLSKKEIGDRNVKFILKYYLGDSIIYKKRTINFR